MKNYNIKLIAFVALCLGASIHANAQTTGQKIGDNPTIKHPSAILELEATNKGVLFPRVSLTTTSNTTTIPNPEPYLLVFNNSRVRIPRGTIDDSGLGFFYWDNNMWVKLLDANSVFGNGLTIRRATATTVLGGPLTEPTTITTSATNTLALPGLQPGTATDKIVVTDANGVLKTVAQLGSSDAWKLTGNTLTGTEFLGSTTATPANVADVVLKRQGFLSGLISSNNTIFGFGAFQSAPINPTDPTNARPQQTVAIGSFSLFRNTTGNSNTAVGSSALEQNTTGDYNTALGARALHFNTTGKDNVAVGLDAGRYQNGSSNTAVGRHALKGTNTADASTAHVSTYNTAVGNSSLIDNTTGSYNVALGYQAGVRNLTGANNTFLGREATIISGAPVINYSTAIGSGAEVATSNSIVLGRVGTTETTREKIGMGVKDPTHVLHVKENVANTDPVRIEGLRVGSATDKIVVADANGVLKTVSTIKATPQFFYAPSMVMPTTNVDLPANVTFNAGTFTVDMYAIYNSQFSMAGDVSGNNRTAVKSTGAGTLDVIPANQLGYFVTYFDNTVYDPASITLTADGKLSYKILAGATVTAKTYMNVVFKAL